MQNLQPVISQLLTLSNTTEQRDGRRDTPLMLARKRGLAQVVDMLLTAGAQDLPSSYSVAGCRVWAPGIYAFNRLIIQICSPMPVKIKVATLTAANAKEKQVIAAVAMKCSATKLTCITVFVWA